MKGYCMDPLTKTDKPDWWFKDIEGCGLHCKDTKYTENEHYQIHKLITYCVLLCIILNIFTVTTFLIDWKTANRYPAKGIFYVNICFAISYGGYLMQFLGYDTREDIVCKKDGTLRKSEPSATENLSCVIVFFMVYYFLIAGLVWFMIFSYAWYMSSLQALGKIQDRVDKKHAYFHLAAWSLPLMLTITTMAIGEIDGDYITGICFVGFANMAARAGLFLAPLVATMLVSIYIIVRGLMLLIKVKIESREVISQHSARKIQSNIVRMTVFTIFMVVFCIVTIGYHIYVASNNDLWVLSLEKYILCKLTSFSTDYSHCKQTERPSVAMLQLQLLAVFGKGIAMASWVWCDATLHAWGRYIRKKFHCEVEEPMKIQKHKIIARAFAGRQKFNAGDKVSVFSQNHTDPVGLRFELNSAASNELSTTWAKNLPRLVNRRLAVPNDVGVDNSYNQSIDSDYSVNYRHVSIESRRNSGDSQVSVQIAELKATKRVKGRRTRRNEKHQFRRNSRHIGNYNSRGPSRANTKRGSSTSLDSHLQMLTALTNGTDVPNFAPNLNRRTATAGLDGTNIGQLIAKGKFVLPSSPLTCSEDENVSVTISERAVNMRLANQNLDLNDQITIKQLRRGLNIRQVSSSESEEEKMSNKDYEQEKRYSRSGRDSHSSKKSKRSRRSRKKYSSDSGSCEARHQKGHHSDSSSCPEIKQLQNAQSSLNSTVSVGFEKNRGSRQSKTSMDVAVQANAHDLDLEMNNKANEEEKISKSKQAKTRENKKYRRASKYGSDVDSSKNLEKISRSKEKYKYDGTGEEKYRLLRDNRKCSENSEEETLIVEKNKVVMKKHREAGVKY
ncbi:protein smoothened isoform X2 [Anthonomus grandis grandis]|uniref:protein smoothened isoform X2 n=1 Tax=Anthonomus grandis grandis TaxID=2921223 RepID=UPI002165F033|nr:protein smoothened isoform X2 [Anthonomus grandis grandis]